jgi:superfamily II DNA/RNA helicase
MGRTSRATQETQSSRPFLTPEAQESYLVSLAYGLVEQRLKNGSASSQETVHFLKLGSAKERYELEKLQEENKLLRAKTESLQGEKRVEELYADAIKAMRKYNGQDESYEDY